MFRPSGFRPQQPAAERHLGARAPGRSLLRGADAAWHRAHTRAWPLVGHAGCAGDGRAQQRARERLNSGLRLLLPDLAFRRLVRDHRRHPGDRRCPALYRCSDFKLALPSAVREENFRAQASAAHRQKEYPRLMLIRPSQLRAVAEDSAFLLPSAPTMSYRRLKCPTVIIAGRDDEIVRSEQTVRLQMAMPHAAVAIVPEAGHMVHYFSADGIVKSAEVVRVEAGAL